MGLFERFKKNNSGESEAQADTENPWSVLEQMPSFQEMQETQAEEPVDPEFRKMLESVSSPEEKAKTLTFENMSKLSTEQYIQLWQELNPFYVTHITRQGVRDHNGMFYHSAGMGELADGFKDIIRDNKTLRSPAMARYGIELGFERADVEKLIDQEVDDEALQEMSAKQIVDRLPLNSSNVSSDPWADRHAIHFAQHTVLDEYYGGEMGNEIFFVFPTDVIASQCRYGGHTHGDSLTTANVIKERKWNDLFVWPKNENIPLDAGLVFLPEDADVDPKTGSRYVTNEKGEALTDEDMIKRFMEWLTSTGEDSPAKELIAAYDSSNTSVIKEKLKELGIPEDKIDDMTSSQELYRLKHFAETGRDNDFSDLYIISKEDRERLTYEEKSLLWCRTYLEEYNAHLKLAENTISSKEYWEAYFAEHPDEKPAHIIYYSGDPSEAVRDFLEENGILEELPRSDYSMSNDFEQALTGPSDTSQQDGVSLGFGQNFLSAEGTKDAAMNAEHERFNQMALEIVEERKRKLTGEDAR